MKYTLRYYQQEAVDSIFEYFSRCNGNPIVAMPTGTGKSLVIGDFIQKACTYYPTTRIMMLTHVKELIDQNSEKLISIWPDAKVGIYSAGLKKKQDFLPITFAGVQSVINNVEAFGWIDLVIVDECHMVPAKSNTTYRKIIDKLLEVNPHLKVIGLSATPYRNGVGTLLDGGVFTDFCYDCTDMKSFNRLIAEGFLCPLVPKKTKAEMDVSGVKVTSNDFVLSQLQKAVDKEDITREAVIETIQEGFASNRQKWLIFASGIEHAEHVSQMFANYGVHAPCVHSKMDEGDRDALIRQFKRGEIRCLVNNDMMTTGHDIPDIDLIGVFRPTQSTALWVQMLGRGTRPFPGKSNCLVLDFGGNTVRLGPINDPILPRKKGQRRSSVGAAPIKLCDQCGAYNHASVRYCTNCNYKFPKEVKIMAEAGEGELIASGVPQVEEFPVTDIFYTRHKKRKGNYSLKVTYYSGIRAFSEYVCLEHEAHKGRGLAIKWWKERSIYEVPETVDAALTVTNQLRRPKLINVWINKPYPEIVSHIF